MWHPALIDIAIMRRDDERREADDARRVADGRRAANANGGLARNLARGLRGLADRLEPAGTRGPA